MAFLNDLLVTGVTRITGILNANKVNTSTILAPISEGSSTFGPGERGQFLVSNGSTVYWATLNHQNFTNGNIQLTQSSSTNVSQYATATVRAASSFTMAGTTVTDSVIIGTLADGYYPISAKIKGTITAGTTGWFTNSGTVQATAATQVGKIAAGTISTGTDNNSSWVKNTTAIVPTGGYLYIGEGYYPNTQISLATLVPDSLTGKTMSTTEAMRQGYFAWDKDGAPIVGAMADVSWINTTAGTQTDNTSDVYGVQIHNTNGYADKASSYIRTLTLPRPSSTIVNSSGSQQKYSGLYTLTLTGGYRTSGGTSTPYITNTSSFIASDAKATTYFGSGYIKEIIMEAGAGPRSHAPQKNGLIYNQSFYTVIDTISASTYCKIKTISLSQSSSIIDTISGQGKINNLESTGAIGIWSGTSGTVSILTGTKTIDNLTGTLTVKKSITAKDQGNLVVNAYNHAETPALTGDKTIVSNGKWVKTELDFNSDSGDYYGLITYTKPTASDLASGNIELTQQTGTSVIGYSTASVQGGSATTPATAITANPRLSTIKETSGYKMSVSATQTVTPTVNAGWVASGTAGTIIVSGSTYIPAAAGSVTMTAGNGTVSAKSNVEFWDTNNGIQVGGRGAVSATARITKEGYTLTNNSFATGSSTSSKEATKYIKGVKLVPPSSGERTFYIQVPNGTDYITLTFKVDSTGNVWVE